MSLSLRFTGGEELARTLNALPTKISRQIKRQVLIDAAEPMVAVARRGAPRRAPSPDIADNIEAVGALGGRDVYGDEKDTTVSIGPVRGFFYGKFLERGTVYMSPRPFLRPAFDSQKDRTVLLVRDGLWREIQSYVQSREVR